MMMMFAKIVLNALLIQEVLVNQRKHNHLLKDWIFLKKEILILITPNLTTKKRALLLCFTVTLTFSLVVVPAELRHLGD